MTFRFARVIALLTLSVACAGVGAAVPGISVQSVKGDFADVRERVVLALENHGLVINYTAHIGDMLERTGKDLGQARQIYGAAEVLEFCSAALSRKMMEADPRNIVFCPYAIAIYTLPNDPARVYLAFRRPLAVGSAQTMKALREVGRLLDDIVRDARK